MSDIFDFGFGIKTSSLENKTNSLLLNIDKSLTDAKDASTKLLLKQDKADHGKKNWRSSVKILLSAVSTNLTRPMANRNPSIFKFSFCKTTNFIPEKGSN